jgi:hypothetical protein
MARDRDRAAAITVIRDYLIPTTEVERQASLDVEAATVPHSGGLLGKLILGRAALTLANAIGNRISSKPAEDPTQAVSSSPAVARVEGLAETSLPSGGPYVEVTADAMDRILELGQAWAKRQELRPFERLFYGDPGRALTARVPGLAVADDGRICSNMEYCRTAMAGGLLDKIKSAVQKVASTGLVSKALKGVSKVANFIPGIGTVVSKVADVAAKGAEKLEKKASSFVGAFPSGEEPSGAGQAIQVAKGRVASYALPSQRAALERADAKDILARATLPALAGDALELTSDDKALLASVGDTLLVPAAAAAVVVPAAPLDSDGDGGEAVANALSLYQSNLAGEVTVPPAAQDEVVRNLEATRGPDEITRGVAGADLGIVSRLADAVNRFVRWSRLGMWPGAGRFSKEVMSPEDVAKAASKGDYGLLAGKEIVQACAAAIPMWKDDVSVAVQDVLTPVLAATGLTQLGQADGWSRSKIKDLVKHLIYLLPPDVQKEDWKQFKSVLRGSASIEEYRELASDLAAALMAVCALQRQGKLPTGSLNGRALADVADAAKQLVNPMDVTLNSEAATNVVRQLTTSLQPLTAQEAASGSTSDDSLGIKLDEEGAAAPTAAGQPAEDGGAPRTTDELSDSTVIETEDGAKWNVPKWIISAAAWMDKNGLLKALAAVGLGAAGSLLANAILNGSSHDRTAAPQAEGSAETEKPGSAHPGASVLVPLSTEGGEL